MAARLIAPEKIKGLREWVTYWPRAQNLEFDTETREPTIFAAARIDTAERTKVGSIPWNRQADIMTILAQPSRYTEAAQTAAKGRYTTYHAQKNATRSTVDTAYSEKEAAVLEAWRAYKAATGPDRIIRRRNVLAAERELRQIEEYYASDATVKKEDYEVDFNPVFSMYRAPYPVETRGLSATEVDTQ